MKRIFTAILLLLPMCLWAQDKLLEEVVVTARSKPAEATLQRVVIDTTILGAYQSASLSELLAQNSPINIKSYGRGDLQSATFRGTAPSHTLVYWNGVKINSPMVGAVDFGQIPIFFVDKLSVEAGVSSMTQASGALGGTVTIENTPQWGTKFGAELVQSIGSFSSYDTYLNIKGGNDKFYGSTKLFQTYSKNDFSFVNRDIIDPARPGYHPNQRNENGDLRRKGFMQEFYAKPSLTEHISFVVWGMDNNTNLPQLTTYEGDGQNNLTNRKDATLKGALTFKHIGELHDITARVTGDLQTMNFSLQNYSGAGYQTTIDSRGLSRSATAQVDASLRFTKDHTIGLNATATIDYVDSREAIKNMGFEKSRAEFSTMGAWYAQWNPRLATSVAARAWAVNGKLYATPFAGLEYRISNPFSLKARVGYNVHTPSISDLYYVPGGNPDLNAERGLTAEVGALFSKNQFKTEINVFNSWISHWIIWLPSHQQYWTPQNMKKVLSRGVELTTSNIWKWDSWGLYASGNITINHTINNGEPIVDGDESVGKQLVYVPLVSGGVFAKGSWKKVWLSYQLYAESERFSTTSNNPQSRSNITPYSLSDLGAGYSWRFISLEMRCRNVFDSQIYTVLRRPLPGRSYEAMIRLKF